MKSSGPSLLDLTLLVVVFAVGFTGLKGCSDGIRNAWNSFNVEDSTAVYRTYKLFEVFRWGTIVFVAPLTLATALRERLPSRGSGEVPSKGTMLCLAATLSLLFTLLGHGYWFVNPANGIATTAAELLEHHAHVGVCTSVVLCFLIWTRFGAPNTSWNERLGSAVGIYWVACFWVNSVLSWLLQFSKA